MTRSEVLKILHHNVSIKELEVLVAEEKKEDDRGFISILNEECL